MLNRLEISFSNLICAATEHKESNLLRSEDNGVDTEIIC